MVNVFALVLALLQPAAAAEAFGSILERERYAKETVRIDTQPGGTVTITNGNAKRLNPGELAVLLGDTARAERYAHSFKLQRRAGILMWSYGGAALLTGVYAGYGSFLMYAVTGDVRFAAYTLTAIGFMATGAVVLPLGFVWYFGGKKKLNDARTWWDIDALERDIEAHNDAVEARYKTSQGRIEVRPTLSPNALALNVRF